jgi:hypothetical protein
MLKLATFACVAVCLTASLAWADPPSASGNVLLAGGNGLYVRADAAAATTGVQGGNVYGSAVNTGGVIRATTAVRSGGRVFLTGGPAGGGISDVRLASVGTPRPEAPAAARPVGLGAFLAMVLGL